MIIEGGSRGSVEVSFGCNLSAVWYSGARTSLAQEVYMPVHTYTKTGTMARALFAGNAVGFNYGRVIRFKSGILSPGAYNNNRMLPSWPDAWDTVLENMKRVAWNIRSDFDLIASVATGGIVHGAALARMLHVPHIIIKKEEKTTHGLKGLIDGDVGLLPRASVLMIEDMSSTFESTLRAMRPIEAEHAKVTHTIAISSWGFPEFFRNVGEHQVHVLCTGDDLVDEAYQMRKISEAYHRQLRSWLADPHNESWIGADWKMPE